jgi:hypothetical protein
MPDPDKMPLDAGDFPYEVQMAFFLYRLLSDRWDGATGTFFGKDWSPIEAFFNIYEIEDRIVTLEIMKTIETHSTEFQNDRTAQKRKNAERAAGAKNYAHNVKG